MVDEDSDDDFDSPYDNGHWKWDNKTNGLVFVSDLVRVEEAIQKPPTIFDSINFKNDMDYFEELRFKKYYQRKLKPNEEDIITLQDIKDVVLFTAPKNILNTGIIKLLHLSATDRYIRALILYCQYYLQITEEMNHRTEEMETKIRTYESENIEQEFKDNLQDLRLLVAKEYCAFISGLNGFMKYHHMGRTKKWRTRTFRDVLIFETSLRIFIQIVWIALGRKKMHEIELEVHRLFKSEEYNSEEHKLCLNYIKKMTPLERNVLLGDCVRRRATLLRYNSPLVNEIYCTRKVPYGMYAVGLLELARLTPRLLYLERAICHPEQILSAASVVVGILGMPKSNFDTLLNFIYKTRGSSKSSTLRTTTSRVSVSSSFAYIGYLDLTSHVVFDREKQSMQCSPLLNYLSNTVNNLSEISIILEPWIDVNRNSIYGKGAKHMSIVVAYIHYVRAISIASASGMKKTTEHGNKCVIPYICFPARVSYEYDIPSKFPKKLRTPLVCHIEQRNRWLSRVNKSNKILK